jgi:flagellar biosynthesis GTPase FlhF
MPVTEEEVNMIAQEDAADAVPCEEGAQARWGERHGHYDRRRPVLIGSLLALGGVAAWAAVSLPGKHSEEGGTTAASGFQESIQELRAEAFEGCGGSGGKEKCRVGCWCKPQGKFYSQCVPPNGLADCDKEAAEDEVHASKRSALLAKAKKAKAELLRKKSAALLASAQEKHETAAKTAKAAKEKHDAAMKEAAKKEAAAIKEAESAVADSQDVMKTAIEKMNQVQDAAAQEKLDATAEERKRAEETAKAEKAAAHELQIAKEAHDKATDVHKDLSDKLDEAELKVKKLVEALL